MKRLTFFSNPCIFLSILSLPGLIWAFADNSVWRWDESWYAQESVSAWYHLTRDTGDYLDALTGQYRTKAPGISWIGQFFVPLGMALGDVENGLLLLIWASTAVTLLMIWRIGLRFEREGVAHVGTVALASSPLVIGLGHFYLVEPLQMAAVTGFFYLAMVGRAMSFWRLSTSLVLLVSLAMLIKVSSPLYAWFPGTVVLYELWRKVQQKEVSKPEGKDYGFATVVFVILVMTVWWYVRNWGHLTEFLRSTSSGEIASYYGREKSVWEGFRLWSGYLFHSTVRVAVGYGFLACLLLALVTGMRQWFRAGRPGLRYSTANLLVVGAVLQFVLILFVYSRQVNEDLRYLLPALPSLAVPVMGLWAWVGGKWLRRVFLVAAVLQWGYAHGQSFGVWKSHWNLHVYDQPVVNGQGMKFDRAMLEAHVFALSSPRAEVMLYVDTERLNPVNLNFIASVQQFYRGMRNNYRHLGWAQDDLEEALGVIHSEEIRAEFVIGYTPERIPKDAFNAVSEAVYNYLEASPEFVRVDYESSWGVVIFRNLKFRPQGVAGQAGGGGDGAQK